ncbi:MAG: MAPEG family protein [Gammaproteobacteria bacterium]
MKVEITALYIALTAFLFIALSYKATKQRRHSKIGLGVGDNEALERAVRVHANLAEYAPIALLLMLAYELNNGAAWLLHLTGAVFVISRVLHAQGLASTRGTSFGRFYGVLGTWSIILILATANIWQLL